MTVQARCSASAKVGLPSPVSADEAQSNGIEEKEELVFGQNTPSRKAKKKISYLESDGSDEDDVFKPRPRARVRSENKQPVKRRKVSESADEDVYEQEEEGADDSGR